MTEKTISLIERIRKSPTVEDLEKVYDSRTVNAIAVVINYTISDAFDLTMEESIWTGWNLSEILEPLKDYKAENLQVAVKQELDTFIYSKALFERDKERGSNHKQMKNVKYASLDEWVESISEIVFESYPEIRPMIRARIIGSLCGHLTELGLSNDNKSRASIYLPSSLRYIVMNREVS